LTKKFRKLKFNILILLQVQVQVLKFSSKISREFGNLILNQEVFSSALSPSFTLSG
jgi:hypothetical protein